MAQDRDHKIRERAHAIWLEEGSPSGRHEEHWEQARREVEGAGVSPKAKAAKAPRAKSVKSGGKAASSKSDADKQPVTMSRSAGAEPVSAPDTPDAGQLEASKDGKAKETAPPKKRGRPVKSAAEQKPVRAATRTLQIKTAT